MKGTPLPLQRRDFITLLGSAAATYSLTAQAQQLRRVGVLSANYSQMDREGQAHLAAFLDTFEKLGWSDGRNVNIDVRWAAGDAERIRLLAAELVRSTPDVILVTSSPGLAELQRLTRTIPMVFTQVGDALEAGFVSSMARPGGNVTGFQVFDAPMGGKWLSMLKEATPNLRRVAALFASDSPANVAFLRAAEAASAFVSVTLTAVDVANGSAVERVIAAIADEPDGGLIVMPNHYTLANRRAIIILAARHRLPAIYPFRYFAAEGGLMSYGPDLIGQWRGAATYVDRILRGEKPSELPVQTPTRLELVINMKTAQALGLKIPAGLPLRADEVIE